MSRSPGGVKLPPAVNKVKNKIHLRKIKLNWIRMKSPPRKRLKHYHARRSLAELFIYFRAGSQTTKVRRWFECHVGVTMAIHRGLEGPHLSTYLLKTSLRKPNTNQGPAGSGLGHVAPPVFRCQGLALEARQGMKGFTVKIHQFGGSLQENKKPRLQILCTQSFKFKHSLLYIFRNWLIQIPIRTRYLAHVTGYQPIRDQYFKYQSVPDISYVT